MSKQLQSAELLILLIGGLGESNIATFTTMLFGDFGKLFSDERDVALIDIRGTYYSQPNLHCSEIFKCDAELQKLNLSVEETLNFITAAVQKAHDKFIKADINLSAFNNQEIANDIDFIMKSVSYKKYNVLGFSAGTLTVQYLLKNHSQSVHSAIMTVIVDRRENLAASNSNTINTLEKIFRI